MTTTNEKEMKIVQTHRADSQFNVDRTYPGVWTITFKNPPINMFVPATIVNWER